MTNFGEGLGFGDRTVDVTSNGERLEASRPVSRRPVATGRSRTKARRRAQAGGDGPRKAAHGRGLPTTDGRRRLGRMTGPARNEGCTLRATPVDGMPRSVSVRFLAPGWGRSQHLCLIHGDPGGDIVASGYGRDRTAAQSAACRDLQARRRA